jgi:hypothetical protein
MQGDDTMPKYTIIITPTVEELRVVNHGEGYGDPFEWSAEIVHLDEGVIELRLVDKPVPKDMWPEILDHFEAAGIREVQFVRFHKGKKSRHILNTDEPRHSRRG